MNPDTAWFISEAAKLGKKLIVRSNLAILDDEKYSGFLRLYADNGAEIVVSLPDLSGKKTDRQRGSGTFEKAMRIMKKLNAPDMQSPGPGSSWTSCITRWARICRARKKRLNLSTAGGCAANTASSSTACSA